MVTVTVSIDCLPLAAVITSSPHCAVLPSRRIAPVAGWRRPARLLGTVTGDRACRSSSRPVSGCATPSVPTRATGALSSAPKP